MTPRPDPILTPRVRPVGAEQSGDNNRSTTSTPSNGPGLSLMRCWSNWVCRCQRPSCRTTGSSCNRADVRRTARDEGVHAAPSNRRRRFRPLLLHDAAVRVDRRRPLGIADLLY